MRLWLTLLAVVLMTGLLLSPRAQAEVNLHGFIQGNYAVNTTSPNPDGDSFKWAEERLQLKLDATQDSLQLFVKADAWHDHLADNADVELREGYLDYAASRWDLRAGRQVLTWGVGDLVFINDVFPKDYEAFFAGRPLEYLKKGVDGLRLGAYPDVVSLEFVLIPLFEPNQYPECGRFWQYDPLPCVTERTTREPGEVLGNGEIAVRAYRRIADFDAALYAYRGYSRQPAMAPDSPATPRSLTFTYPELAVYGASLQGSALDGVVSLEAGAYDSLDDQDGADPMLPNSQLRILVGYQRQLWEEGTLGLQYYSEIMQEYDAYTASMPAGLPWERETHGYITLRFTQFFRNQTLKLSWFSFVSPDEGDYLLNPEITYHFTDHVWGAVGAIRTKDATELLYARQAVVAACAANDLQAIDIVFIDFKDPDGLRLEAEQGAGFGFSGKQIIHPNQIVPVQEAFTPSDAALEYAKRIVESFEASQKEGKGAYALDGRMIDMPLLKNAQKVLERARAAGKI